MVTKLISQSDSFLSEKYVSLCFYIFILAHLLIWTLTPALIYGNPPNDSLEGIAWGNLWLFGYSKHPFLAPWLSATFTNIFGTVGWPIYFLSELCIVTCFIAIWQLAKKFVSPWHALIAVMLLEGINYYNLQSAVFDPNILMLPLWALAALYFYNAIDKNKVLDWILLGVCAGLSMLSKYESAIFIFILFAYLFSYPQGRRYFLEYKVYLAAIIAFLIFLPNLIWLSHHHFIAVNYATEEMLSGHSGWIRRFYNPTLFTFEQVANLLPILLLYLPFWDQNQGKLSLSELNDRYIKFIALGPLLFTLIFSFATHSTLVSRWGFPFFSFVGLLWLIWFYPLISKARLVSFIILVAGLNLMMIAGDMYVFLYKPTRSHHASYSAFFPGKQVAFAVTAQWHQYYQQPLKYVAGDQRVLNNISSFSPDKPIPYFNLSTDDSPWINKTDFVNNGAVFAVWLRDAEAAQRIEDIKKAYPKLAHESVQAFQPLTKAKIEPIKLWIGYLAPSPVKTP